MTTPSRPQETYLFPPLRTSNRLIMSVWSPGREILMFPPLISFARFFFSVYFTLVVSLASLAAWFSTKRKEENSFQSILPSNKPLKIITKGLLAAWHQ